MNTLAAQQGRPITALSLVGDWIYSGFGDWSANGDHTAVVRHHLETGEEEILFERDGTFETGLYTEAVENVHGFDGALYVPHVDGLGYWEGCGYATNEGGEWHNVRLPGQALHVFQMAQTPEGMWACGSRITPDQSNAVAALWFRPTGAGEDEWVHRLDAATPSASSRFWIMHVDGSEVTVSDHAGHYAEWIYITATATTRSESAEPPPGALLPVHYKQRTISAGPHIYRGEGDGAIHRSING